MLVEVVSKYQNLLKLENIIIVLIVVCLIYKDGRSKREREIYWKRIVKWKSLFSLWGKSMDVFEKW